MVLVVLLWYCGYGNSFFDRLKTCARKLDSDFLLIVSPVISSLKDTAIAVTASVAITLIGGQFLSACAAGTLSKRVFLACVLFAAVMVGLGWAIGRVVLADGGERRALVFTGVTRNSLVVLPLVRAVDREGPGTAAVVTQTLVELVVMAVLVWLVPRMVPSTAMSENR